MNMMQQLWYLDIFMMIIKMILGKMIQTIKPGGLIMFEVYSKTNKLWYWWTKRC